MNHLNRIKCGLLAGLLLLLCTGMTAEFVSPAQAFGAAQNWLTWRQDGEALTLKSLKSYRNNELRAMSLKAEIPNHQLPELYVFYFTNGSFVVVPADNNLRPVLAYSSLALKDPEDMPPAFQMWLEFYASDVVRVRETSFEHSENQRLWQEISANDFGSIPRNRDVSPLLKTNWNQDWPYNELCPLDPAGPGGRVYVGCVATAMAQVMKYWNKPITGQGSSSYYAYGYGYQSVNYGNTTYLWDEMPNSVSGSNIPVATLMYHAAVSVEMGFAPDGSGSNGMKARNAFESYWGYPGATYNQKQSYSSTQWESLLRAQLDNGIPMYYSGSNTDSGHAWNCDGYQGTDYFHFNFGWSGSYNGYYYLNSITPGSNSFNLYQAAITNTTPANYTMTQPRIQLFANPPSAGDPFTLRMSTYPVLADWEVDDISLSLFYDHTAMQYTGYDLNGTLAANGNFQVVDDGNGYLNITWNRTTPIVGGGDLFKFIFRAIEPGNFYFGPVDMKYNGQILQNVEPLLLDVTAPVATLAQSRITLTNAMHVGMNQLGTMAMNSTYLPPSWNVTHVDFKVNFNAELISFEDIQTEGTLIETHLDLQSTIISPGVVHVTIQTDQPLSGLGMPLLKLRFRAIGNGPTAVPVSVSLTDFMYNTTPITNTGTGIFVLSAVSSVDEDTPMPVFNASVYPNPFNPSTTILLSLPNAQMTDVSIYNLKGQKVITLHNDPLASGEHRFIWHGKDELRNNVGNGIYLLKIQTENGTITRKLSLMK